MLLLALKTRLAGVGIPGGIEMSRLWSRKSRTYERYRQGGAINPCRSLEGVACTSEGNMVGKKSTRNKVNESTKLLP